MTELIASSVRLSTPLIFAAMGGILCERSGLATICLEGVLLASAWIAAVVNFQTGEPAVALLAALGVGALTMGLHAVLTISAKADHIISAVAVNIIAAGFTPLLNKVLYGGPTNTPSIPLKERMSEWPIPFLQDIPFFGSAFFHHIPLVYLALVLPFILMYLLFRTRFGQHLLAAGDGPQALETAGVSVKKTRYAALLLGGAVTSLGGVYLSIAHASQFTRDMTAGRGFIALTAVIFGKWKPIPTFFACLLIGLADALQIQLQSATWNGHTIPVQFIQVIPYLIALFVLVGFVGQARPPLAIAATDAPR